MYFWYVLFITYIIIAFYNLGGPLMYLNRTTQKFVLIGTVFGGGYDCKKDVVNAWEGSRNGLWNKVSAHMNWIKRTMHELGEEICKNEE